MLAGRNYAFWTAAVLILVGPMLLISYLQDGKDAGESLQAGIVATGLGVAMTLLFSFRPLRAWKTVRRLRRTGELENALADLNSDRVYFIPFTTPDPNSVAQCNVLGERYIFLFSSGRVIRYYQIRALAVSRVENRLQLNITDRFGKSFSLIETDGSNISLIARCVGELRSRYPGLPDLSRSDELIINI